MFMFKELYNQLDDMSTELWNEFGELVEWHNSVLEAERFIHNELMTFLYDHRNDVTEEEYDKLYNEFIG